MNEYWELRYRSTLSPTRGVDDVRILVDDRHVAAHNGDRAAAAKELADWYLTKKVPSPSTKFVYVRPDVVATSAEMRADQSPTAAAKKVDDEPTSGPSPAQAASRDNMPDTDREKAGAGRPSGRIGA